MERLDGNEGKKELVRVQPAILKNAEVSEGDTDVCISQIISMLHSIAIDSLFYPIIKQEIQFPLLNDLRRDMNIFFDYYDKGDIHYSFFINNLNYSIFRTMTYSYLASQASGKISLSPEEKIISELFLVLSNEKFFEIYEKLNSEINRFSKENRLLIRGYYLRKNEEIKKREMEAKLSRVTVRLRPPWDIKKGINSRPPWDSKEVKTNSRRPFWESEEVKTNSRRPLGESEKAMYASSWGEDRKIEEEKKYDLSSSDENKIEWYTSSFEKLGFIITHKGFICNTEECNHSLTTKLASSRGTIPL